MAISQFRLQAYQFLIMFLFFLFFLISPDIRAQTEKPRETTRPYPTSASATKGTDKVSFFFDDADLYDVIQSIFGEVLKANYIIDPKVQGKVNFKTTTPISKDDILPVMEIILRLNGIGIVKEDEVYTIIPMTNTVKEPTQIQFGSDPKNIHEKGTVIVQIIPLEFITSAEVYKVINPFVSQGGVILDIPEYNFIIISDTDKNIKRILQMIAFFDVEGFQDIVKPQIYVYLLKNSKADHVAQILQDLFLGTSTVTPKKTTRPLVKRTPTYRKGQQQPRETTPRRQLKPTIAEEPLVAPGTKIFHDEISNAIIILATRSDYKLIEETIKRIDLIPRQVLVEVLFAQITMTDDLEYGIQWLFRGSWQREKGAPHRRTAIQFAPNVTPTDGVTFTITVEDEVRLLITSLVQQNKAQVLASPHIIAADNTEAKIQIGSEEPIVTQTQTDTTNPDIIRSNVQYRDTGIILTVKPQVNDGGLIALDVRTEVSTVAGQGAGDSPRFDKTEAATNLIIQNGDTIVIGGLIREDKRNNLEGIPYLSNIPYLGPLFSQRVEEVRKRELVILLTPHVIKNRQESDIVSDEYIEKLRELKKKLKPQQISKKIR